MFLMRMGLEQGRPLLERKSIGAEIMSNTEKVRIDVTLVHHLITTQFLQWADLPIKPVQSAGSASEQVDKGQKWFVGF